MCPAPVLFLAALGLVAVLLAAAGGAVLVVLAVRGRERDDD